MSTESLASVRAVSSEKMGTVFCTTGATTTDTAGGAPWAEALLASVFPPPQPVRKASAAKNTANPSGRSGHCHWYASEEVMSLLSDTYCPLGGSMLWMRGKIHCISPELAPHNTRGLFFEGPGRGPILPEEQVSLPRRRSC